MIHSCIGCYVVFGQELYLEFTAIATEINKQFLLTYN